MNRFGFCLSLFTCLLASFLANKTLAAENLKLRDGISFYQDIDSDFPIVADKMDDYAIGDGCATFVFFGARGDLNTNRQAKRLVDLYKQYASDKLKFVVVDVDHIKGDQGRQLVKSIIMATFPMKYFSISPVTLFGRKLVK